MCSRMCPALPCLLNDRVSSSPDFVKQATFSANCAKAACRNQLPLYSFNISPTPFIIVAIRDFQKNLSHKFFIRSLDFDHTDDAICTLQSFLIRKFQIQLRKYRVIACHVEDIFNSYVPDGKFPLGELSDEFLEPSCRFEFSRKSSTCLDFARVNKDTVLAPRL